MKVIFEIEGKTGEGQVSYSDISVEEREVTQREN